MFRKRFYYIIELQYLGFRYHGWQKQPNVNTLQRMVERTVSYVLKHKDFKVLASGRTDAKVSANQTYIELFVDYQPLDMISFFPFYQSISEVKCLCFFIIICSIVSSILCPFYV